MAWVTGALFQTGDTEVLVELLPNGNEIELRARGLERKPLLSVIAADADALNASFQGLREKVHKLIPCNCSRCSGSSTPELFLEKQLLHRKEHNRRTVECPSSYDNVNVTELLDGFYTPGRDRPIRKIRIFLACSAELRADRDEFDLYFRQQNDALINDGIYLEILRWEHFLDTMSRTRLQDEYNASIRDCDIFVSLFFTRTGRYTGEEFTVAWERFKVAGKPDILTYFKDAEITTGAACEKDLISLLAFKKKLQRLGHYPTTYTDAEHLKRHFRDQLARLLTRSANRISGAFKW
jgi:hypothetical protein